MGPRSEDRQETMVSAGTSGSKVQPFALIVSSATILRLSPEDLAHYAVHITANPLYARVVPRLPQCDNPLLEFHTHPVYSALEFTASLQSPEPVRRAYLN